MLLLAVLLFASVAALTVSAQPAAAKGVPFTDPSARGVISLCDRDGNPITEGSTTTAPFVWKAVGSVAPPSPYTGKGENAVLIAYQARDGVQPALWNGEDLGAASFYENPLEPATEQTDRDEKLSVLMNDYPPMWDGLYELRMYFGRTNVGLYNDTYPAAVIQVKGNRWSLVYGGGERCSSPAVSNEVLAGIVPANETVPPTTSAAAKPSPPNVNVTPVPFTIMPSTPQPSELPSSSDAPLVATAASGGGSSTGGWVLGGLLTAVLVVLGLAFAYRRGQRSAHS